MPGYHCCERSNAVKQQWSAVRSSPLASLQLAPALFGLNVAALFSFEQRWLLSVFMVNLMLL